MNQEDEEDLYDEFGNYIGPSLSDEEDDGTDEGNEEEEEEEEEEDLFGFKEEDVDISTKAGIGERGGDEETSIVLHEDKQYYPEADDVYPGVETVFMDEDDMPITEPIIKPIKTKSFSVLADVKSQLKYSPEYMGGLAENPQLIRNVCVAGHYHHGKTSLVDILVEQTHVKSWPLDQAVKYADTRKDEQERGLSIKSTPISMVLQDHRDKSYLMNIIDVPGHIDFLDEVSAGMRVADGAAIVVDAVEGVLISTRRAVRSAAKHGLAVVLVITKIDRLILELKLPPEDAYFKIRHIISEVNAILDTFGSVTVTKRVSPLLGNVCFASGSEMWSFTLESMARVYARRCPGVNARAFARRLWGDVYYDPANRKFKKSPHSGSAKRTFVEFCLEPLYKLYAQTVGEESVTLASTLAQLGIKLKAKELYMDSKPLLRLVLQRFFGCDRTTGFVDMIAKHVPSPLDGNARKVDGFYRGDPNSKIAQSMKACDANGSLMINVVKSYSTANAQDFVVLGRIMSGAVRAGQAIRVLGESYSLDDDEDMVKSTVRSVAMGQGRLRTDVSQLNAGNWCLLEGVDASIVKTATIADTDDLSVNSASIFAPLVFDTVSTVKVAVEPLKPSELPKMLEGLRKVNKSYPLVRTRVEESGEHVVLGTGELYMDCVLHDLRRMYSEVEIKVADPVVAFCETVVETSSVKCFAETPNKRNQLSMIAEPLAKGLAGDIESGTVDIEWSAKRIGDFFQSKYDWDLLAARSIWAFGPERSGPNILVDDALPSAANKSLLRAVKGHVVQGFQWGCREGPLCEAPIRNVKFKILDAEISEAPIHRGGAQLIPTARRVAYSSFLMATPRLMEPVYACEIVAPYDAMSSVFKVLKRRRGHVTRDIPLPGSPFYTIQAYLPVIESFGFETDLRVYTQGLAFCQNTFDHWAIVPGDPLDKSIALRPLEPSPMPHLAREFMIKTRRRKGLSEDVSISKFFDESMLLELEKQDPEFHKSL
eukprot:g1799.t1